MKMKLNNKGFSKIETLIIVVIVAALLLLGIILVSTTTTNKNIDTFKKDTTSILNASKNVYGNLEKIESSYITTSSEAISTGVCITLNGLKENVVIGHMIPAGTGMKAYKKIKLYDENMEDLDVSINRILEEKKANPIGVNAIIDKDSILGM
jgi:competence protein ComGC